MSDQASTLNMDAEFGSFDDKKEVEPKQTKTLELADISKKLMAQKKDKTEVDMSSSTQSSPFNKSSSIDVSETTALNPKKESIVQVDQTPAPVEEEETPEEKAAKTRREKIKDWIYTAVLWGIPLLCILLIIGANAEIGTLQQRKPCKLSVYTFPNTTAVYSANSSTITIYDPATPINTTFNCNFPAKKSLSRGWKIVLSFIPFVVIFQGILGFKLSSKIVAPAGCIVTIFLGCGFFQDSKEYVNDDLPAIMGKITLTILDRLLWTIFDYALNMFSALFFLEVCKGWGIVERIRMEFEKITTDPNRLLVLVLSCFGMILAVVAPGGTNYLIAGAILIKMNMKSEAEGEDRTRIIAEYKHRHEKCTDKTCMHFKNPSDDDILRVDNNNRIAEICLFGNALASAFNLLGVCITATASLVSPLDTENADKNQEELDRYAALEIGRLFAAQFVLLGIVSPALMNIIYSKKRYLWQRVMDPTISRWDWTVMFIIGTVFAFVQFLTAAFIGPELPCLLSGLAALIVFIGVEKWRQIYTRVWPEKSDRRYLIPFVLLMVILLLIRLIPGLEDGLTGKNDETANSVLAPKLKLGGYSKVDFPWLVHSGVIVSCIALATPFMVKFYKPDTQLNLFFPKGGSRAGMADAMKRLKMFTSAVSKFMSPIAKRREAAEGRKRVQVVIVDAFKEAFHETYSILISITGFASMARLMASFEMTQTIALAIVDVFDSVPALYAICIPIIGMLGSGLTGSTTTSNFLFSKLQVNTANSLGLIKPGYNSVYEITAAQILGASAGEIISPMNAVVCTIMEGVDKKESDMIKDLLGIAFLWLLGCMLISLVFIVPDGFID